MLLKKQLLLKTIDSVFVDGRKFEYHIFPSSFLSLQVLLHIYRIIEFFLQKVTIMIIQLRTHFSKIQAQKHYCFKNNQ